MGFSRQGISSALKMEFDLAKLFVVQTEMKVQIYDTGGQNVRVIQEVCKNITRAVQRPILLRSIVCGFESNEGGVSLPSRYSIYPCLLLLIATLTREGGQDMRRFGCSGILHNDIGYLGTIGNRTKILAMYVYRTTGVVGAD